jgi:hypothetical protein
MLAATGKAHPLRSVAEACAYWSEIDVGALGGVQPMSCDNSCLQHPAISLATNCDNRCHSLSITPKHSQRQNGSTQKTQTLYTMDGYA